MALASLPRLWPLGRRVEDLFKFQTEAKGAFADVATRFDALEKGLGARLRAAEDRLTRLEAEQGQVVSEARSAATAAATMIAGAVISDAVTRVTRVEEGIRRLEQRRLPPRAIPDEGPAV
jgi:hypothetical protein